MIVNRNKYQELEERVRILEETLIMLGSKVDRFRGHLNDPVVKVEPHYIHGLTVPTFYGPATRPTIRGKIDAIIKYLDITFDYIPKSEKDEHFIAREVKK